MLNPLPQQLELPLSHRWTFPLSARKPITADVRIHGSHVGVPEIRALQRYINLIEATYGEGTPGPQPEDLETIAPGDIVQLKPSADPTFGGLLLRVRKVEPIRGYLLIPRRGGSLETWMRVKPCEIGKIGALRWPEAEWGFRHF